ncbi:MAG: MFS transporter [Chloroflexota bacterium]
MLHPELHKHLKHNLTVNILDGGFFGLAIGFASFSTILPLFVSSMTDSAILIGLIPALHSASWQIPQLFTANWVARQKRFKPMVLWLTTQERVPFLGLAVVAWMLPSLGNRLALTLTFLLIAWQSLGAGFTANAWQSLVAKIIPGDRRGTFFGAQAAAANLLASVSAILAGLILEGVVGSRSYALCFLLCSFFMIFSWVSLALTREPEKPVDEIAAAPISFWNNLGAILRRDRNFRWYLVARMLAQLGVMGFAFYAVYAVNHHGMSKAEAGVMTSVLFGTQIIANPLMGWLGDRWSHLKLLEVGALAAMGSALLAWWAPSAGWFYPVVILAGIASVAIWTIGMAITLEFGSEAERPTYIGMANTLAAPANILAPFLGGWLADAAGYPATFLASAVASLVTLAAFHFLIQDPRKLKARHPSSI